tara:strand:- start:565 stop:1473 length:909 start_codon:yes stop_codon:yes gene_type:complete
MTQQDTRPPQPSEADIILRELANAGVEPGEDMDAELAQDLAQGPRTEVVQQETAPTVSEGLETPVVGTTPQVGLVDNMPGAMTMTVVQDPGLITVYNRFTGDPSKCNVNMLPAQLRKRMNDRTDPASFGKLAFTTTDPGFRPASGNMKCWLHADGEWRLLGDEWGLPRCTKSNIPTPLNVEQHVRLKHNQSFLIIERQIRDNRRDEDREEAREDRKNTQRLLEIIAGRQEARAEAEDELEEAIVEAGGPTTVEAPEPEIDWRGAAKDGHCALKCGWTTDAAKVGSRRAAMYAHRKQEHPETR